MSAVAFILFLPVSALIVLNLAFMVEVALGLLQSPPRNRLTGSVQDIAVLMPAHNEASIISDTLHRLLLAIPPNARLLVVADNCDDDTADIVRGNGVEVVERHDPENRGKGFALAFGRDSLRGSPPACVIILDADTDASPGSLERLAATALTTGRPVQAVYLMSPNGEAGPFVQISAFAFLVKNFVRQRGLARLGVPAVLTGSGMAFPWNGFEQASLATDDLVEDLALGIELGLMGAPPVFEPGAEVWSATSSASGTMSQRTRWESGFLATAKLHGGRLLWRGVRLRQWAYFWTGLHLMIPPLSLLLMLDAAALSATGAIALTGEARGLALLLASEVAIIGSLLITTWLLHGRSYLTLKTLVLAPVYVLRKVPIYLGVIRQRQLGWVKTER